MMRLLVFTLFLFVCARSVAQTTVISTGDIRLAIEVYDYENDRPINISKISDGFNEDGLPINLVLPYKSSIQLWLPDVNDENISMYRLTKKDGKIRKLEESYEEFQGKQVVFLGSRSFSGGSFDEINILEIDPLRGLGPNAKQVSLTWQVDFGPIELAAFIKNDEIDERQQLIDSVMNNLFSVSIDEIVKGYDYWLEKGFATVLDDDGMPENPILPIGAGTIGFATSAPQVTLTRNGEPVEFERVERRINTESAIYFFKPQESGSYVLRMTDPRKVYGQASRTYSFSVPFNFWKEGGFWLVGIIGLIVVGFLVYRGNTKRKLAKSYLLKQLSDAELKAIRSQLNPHFLFNALSAIQNLVNQGENDLANDYIVKLSKLLRRVLVQSDESLHSLQEELELAALYLELEKLRIPFDFHIKVDETLDKNVLVPSMILQPYLENAVFHGVSKFKANQISLVVGQLGDQLIFEIKDNANHEGNFFTEGKGMSMGRERIDILRKQLGNQLRAGINTTKGTNGFEVEISLPLNL